MKRAEKLYIQNVEKILKVERKKLYYWEKVGKIPKSKREVMSNYRFWTLADVEKIKRIITGREI
ncbi:MAG: MerR family transcriptional regulator [Candidatus Omnitrophota bacterium]|jgi:DNA-binding transcriptional MerR regulator